MTYDAGSSRALYELDASPFYQEVERIKRAYAELRNLGGQAASGTQTAGWLNAIRPHVARPRKANCRAATSR